MGYRAGAGSYRGRKNWSVGVPPSDTEQKVINFLVTAFIVASIWVYFVMKGWI